MTVADSRGGCGEEEADVTSLLNSICNFDFVVTIVIVQICLAFKKGPSKSLDLD
jgi:hypothetical protein